LMSLIKLAVEQQNENIQDKVAPFDIKHRNIRSMDHPA